MEDNNSDQEKRLSQKIAAILDEVRTSYATHNRKLKELSLLRSKSTSPSHFFSAFSKSLISLFKFQRRIASADRVVSFVASFTAARNPSDASDCDEFLDHFLHFLLVAMAAADKTVRFRACQVLSEVTDWAKFNLIILCYFSVLGFIYEHLISPTNVTINYWVWKKYGGYEHLISSIILVVIL